MEDFFRYFINTNILESLGITSIIIWVSVLIIIFLIWHLISSRNISIRSFLDDNPLKSEALMKAQAYNEERKPKKLEETEKNKSDLKNNSFENNQEQNLLNFLLQTKKLAEAFKIFSGKTVLDCTAKKHFNNVIKEAKEANIELAQKNLYRIEKTLNDATKYQGDSDQVKSERYFLLGGISELLMRYDVAEDYFKKARSFGAGKEQENMVNLLSKDEKSDEQIQSVGAELSLLIKQGVKLTKAQIKAFIQEVINKDPEDLAKIILTLHKIGKNLENSGDIEATILFFQEAVKIYDEFEKKYPGHYSSNLIHTHKKLVDLFEQTNKTTQAIEYCDKLANIYREFNTDGDIDINADCKEKLVSTLMHLSKLHNKNEDSIATIEVLKETEEIYRKLIQGLKWSPHHRSGLIEVLSSMGNIFNDLKKYRKSLECLQEALKLAYKQADYNNYSGNDLKTLSNILNNIGTAYIGTADYVKATAALQKAVKLLRKLVLLDSSSNNIHLAFSLNQLGTIHWIQENYSKALPYLEEAREIKKSVFGSKKRFG